MYFFDFVLVALCFFVADFCARGTGVGGFSIEAATDFEPRVISSLVTQSNNKVAKMCREIKTKVSFDGLNASSIFFMMRYKLFSEITLVIIKYSLCMT